MPTIRGAKVSDLTAAVMAAFDTGAYVRAERAVLAVDREIRKAWDELLLLTVSRGTFGEIRRGAEMILGSIPSRTIAVLTDQMRAQTRLTYDELFQAWVDFAPKYVWDFFETKARLTSPAVEAVRFNREIQATIYDPPTAEEAEAAIWTPLPGDSSGMTWDQRLSPRYAGFDVGAASRTMAAGMAEGMNPREVARLLNPYVTGYRNRAVTVARTEMVRAAQEIGRKYLERDFADVTGGWQVLSAGDNRVRPEHEARHGMIWSDDPALFPDAPLADRIYTPDAPNCRCTMIALVSPRASVLSRLRGF